MPGMAFDLARYTRACAPVDDGDIDYGAFAERPLSPAALRTLRYMCDIESHTVCYLRDMLVTPSHRDPEITTFMTMWNYEEFWHGEVLAKVLAAHGVPTGAAHVRAVRSGAGWRDRLAPVAQSVAGNVLGDDFIAVHMAWGAVNEWSTHAGYPRLIEREDHPVLTTLLVRIARQETRHIAFYATQARTRLAASARARRLTRFALARFWQPVGSGVMPSAETRHLLRHLFGGVEGAALVAPLDERIDGLPGLAGLGLVRAAARRWRLDAGPARPGPVLAPA